MIVVNFSRPQIAALRAFIVSHEKHDTLSFLVQKQGHGNESEIYCAACGARFYFKDFTGQKDAVNGRMVL